MQQRANISVLPVPFDYGAGRGGAAHGPAAIVEAGLPQKLQSLGFPYVLHSSGYMPDIQFDLRTSAQMKNWGRVLKMSEAVAAATAAIDAAGDFPLILGGDHSIAIGTVAGLAERRQRLGVLWIDAHSDLNTPQTTPSGNLHGMSLAAGLGRGDPRFVSLRGAAPKLQPERTVLIGARQLDAGERQTIASLGIRCFTMHDIDRRGMSEVMEEALAILSGAGCDGVHLSFDIDSVDPGEAPGTDTPVRGGLTYREAHLAMELIHDASILTSAELVEVNPYLERSGRTAQLAVELIGSMLGEKI
ncbi:arginase [Paenibacillus beijingensis]|uniref:Arginase n=1 Tax=Paenibacillus beijingensis TaxID=1126833 RepID=A0A0D5NMW7_9BACL|nr:arginase [Paenibacillus beijingensis]AJY76515.1 arginase [Paenibacillus beijingensis]